MRLIEGSSVSFRSGQLAIPFAAIREEKNLVLRVANLAGEEFSDPFFSDTVGRFRLSSECLEWRLSRTWLTKKRPPLLRKPAGIIFHMSRCGSTLVSQALKCIAGCVVYSEPTSINDALMPPWEDWSSQEISSALNTVVTLLAHAAQGRPYVLKLRSWNSLFAKTVLNLFPGVPWAFVVRDPVEVAVSAIMRPPTWLRSFTCQNNPFLRHLEKRDALKHTQESYVASILAAFIQTIANVDKTDGCLIQYEQLPNAAWETLARHFGLNATDNDVIRMAQAAPFYSKDSTRSRVFLSDSHYKQLVASSKLRREIQSRTQPALINLLGQFRTP